MSFYVTLPSNGADLSSEYARSINKISDFTTFLYNSIDFGNKKFEVALVDASYRKTWKIDIGTITLFKWVGVLRLEEHKVTINVFDGITISQMMNIINQKFGVDANFFIFKEGTLEINIPNENIEFEITGYLATYLLSNKFNINPKFYGLKITNIIRRDYFSKNVEINNENQTILIKGSDVINLTIGITANFLKYNEEIFIYTDIIETSYVGSQKTNLLKIITDDSKYDDIIHKTYANPHYVPLRSNFIEKIRIFMRNSEGHPIKFQDNHSRVVYKLHFRESI